MVRSQNLGHSLGAERVALYRQRQKEKDGYNAEEERKKEARRIAQIRARKKKCPLGRKCTDKTCSLHPDRGRVRPERVSSTSRQECGKKLNRKNKRRLSKENKGLKIQVKGLINKNRRLERQLKNTKQQTESPESDSGEENVEDDQCAVQFLLSSMSPLSKKKTLKRAATTPAFTPVMKKLRNTHNIQLRTERLFTEDQQYLSPLGEK